MLLGEVIERPASVVKELVENSIDAGAKNIIIEIEKGGVSLIRITDDGKGIKQDDVEIAFERHATSKIRSANDLEEISTMGFRGEALASIASISKINLITKTADEEMGTQIILEAGDVKDLQSIGASVGTSMTIEELFFNTPVRYKFLKKDYTEAGYIEDIVKKLAIINKDIAFKLINNGKIILQTTGNGDTKSVIYSIFGEEIANAIIESEHETENIKIKGIVGKPEIARSNRRNQIFFVNGRPIKDGTLTAATTKAFKGLIPLGRFGFSILDIRIDPKLIDVNVHPTKEEIRFREEGEVFKAVNTTIHNALAKSELVENVFVPKYDDNNFSHFNNYQATGKLDSEEVNKALENTEKTIPSKRTKGFFNFKEKKSDRDIEEEELEKKHSEIYEALTKNPKFSYQEMLKEKEGQEEKELKENDEFSEDHASLDWIGEEQTTEKLSKIKEQIDRTASLNIHTILNRYKEQVEEEEEEFEERIREEIRERDEELVEKTDEVQDAVIEETESNEERIEIEVLEETDIEKEDEDNDISNEERYRALFQTDKISLQDREENVEFKEEISEETQKEELEEVDRPSQMIETEAILNQLKSELDEDASKDDILSKIQAIIAKEAVTTTPELKPLAQEDKEYEDSFSTEIKESVLQDVDIEPDTMTDFKPVEKESFIEDAESALANLKKKLDSKDGEFIETGNIVENLISSKMSKGETTNVLDLDAVNKILEEELKEKQELESKASIGNKFDFSKMYRRAFGVDSYEEQKEKKAFEESIDMSQSFKKPELTLFNDNIPVYSVIGVAFGTYIIIEMRDSIYMIDQHATHERLLYEEVKLNYYNEQYKDSQTLLLPDVITLSYREMEIVRSNMDVFKKAGFELEEFGINTIKLIAVPSMTEILNTKELFLDILDELDSSYVTGKDEIEERFLSTIACKAAVKANMVLDEKEIRALLDDLLSLPNPFTCPHGRPTAIKMTKKDLERKFARR